MPPAREVLDQLDPQLLGWVEAQWGTEVADADRLAGGVTSTMLRLTGVDDYRAVLRLMTEEPWRRHGEGLLAREAEIQRFLEATAVPAPRSLAVDPCGVATGVPVHLMSFVPGTVDLTRSDEAFLDAVSETLSAIQALDPPSRPREFQTWAPTSKWIVPEWAGDAGLWRSSAVTPSAELLQIDGGWRHGPDQPLLSTSVDIMQLIGTLMVVEPAAASAVGIGSVNDSDDGHAMVDVVDPIDHAIGAATCTVPVVERRPEPLADTLWVVQQWSDDELVRRKGNGLRKVLRELSPSRR